MDYRKLFDYITKIILAAIFSFSLIYPLTTTMHFPFSPFIITGFAFVLILIYSVAFLNKLTSRISFILILSGILFFAVYTLTINGDLLYGFVGSFLWLISYITQQVSFELTSALIVTIVISVLLSLFVYIFSIKKFKFILLLISGIATYASQWILNFYVDKAAVSFYLFVLSILVYYLIHVYNKKCFYDSNDYTGFANFILSVLPVCIVVLLISIAIPVKSNPIEWPWLDKKLVMAVNYLNNYGKINLSEASYFSLTEIGFGNSNNLGGNVQLNDTKVMEVTGPRNLYLRGRSSDLYNGRAWVNTKLVHQKFDSQGNSINPDVFEMKNGLKLLQKLYGKTDSGNSEPSNAQLPDFVWKSYTTVKFSNILTKSLFVPLRSEAFTIKDTIKKSMDVTRDGILSSGIALTKDFKYSFDTYTISYQNEEFKNTMINSRKGLYDDALLDVNTEIYNSIFNDFVQSRIDSVFGIDSQEIWNANYTLRGDIYDSNYNTNSYDSNYIYEYLPRLPYNDRDYLINIYLPAQFAMLKIDLNNILYYSPSTYDLKESISSYLLDFLKLISEENMPDLEEELDELLSETKYTLLFNERNNIITLKKISEEAYSDYLDIPESLPERVKLLAESITKDKNNDYDRVKAIEQFLSTSYPYTLSPGDTPEGRDFVDYFLFDLQKGYCTYFASSMAILTRCIGMPSRYIEGYILPPKMEKNSTYYVTNQQAHAWVEVYFEGIGWLPFEPTSSFSNSLYSVVSRPSYNGMPSQYRPQGNMNIPGNSGNVNYPTGDIEVDTTTAGLTVTFFTVCGLIAFILLVILFNIIKRKLWIRRMKKKNAKESIINLYEYFLKHLKLYQATSLKSGETPFEYAQRLDKHGYIHPYSFKEIADIFVKARYSQTEITESEKNTIFKFYKSVFDITRSNMSRLKYFLIVYILGKL